MALERTIERNVDIFLSANGWEIDNPSKKNVFYQSALPEQYAKRLEGTRPDYTLFYEYKPIGIIEVKKPGSDLNKAMEQALGYAKKLNAPLVFATDGSFCKSQWLYDGKTLILNNEEVSELLPFSDAVKFIKDNSSSVFTIDEKVIKSRAELITIFASLNDVLRSDGIRAGMDRFSEFANILFLKLISDQSNLDYWERIKNQNDADLIDYINKTLFDKITLKYGGNVFEPLLINNVKTLREIIRRIDHLSLVSIDTDIKGGAFEYFIEKTTTTQNDLGEYYTPRHIVKAMMSLVKPKMGEKIYDPFCGTGGFLTGAFQHILKHVKCVPGSNEEEKLKKETLYGGEITTNARIAKMNMILYGDGHSGVNQIDSLANPVKELYDLVVTNIPFSQKVTKDISNLYNNGLAKNNGDAACLLHCFESLKPGGRMAVVVPEGVLFRNDLKKIRQYLCENSKLHSIISLPQGVFLPYTKVRTSILYFTNKGEKTLKYWYFKVNNDGFSLDAKRQKIKGTNDLHVLDSCVDRLKKGDLIEGFHQVDLNKNTYSFHFVEEEKKTNSNWPIVELGELIEQNIIFAKKGNAITKNTAINGDIPVIAGGEKSPYSHNKANYFGNVITIAASGTAGYVCYHSNPIWASDCNVLCSNDEKILSTKFLYFVLKSLQEKIMSLATGAVQKHIYVKDLINIQIPFPSFAEQKKILEYLESKHELIKQQKEAIKCFETDIDEKLESLWRKV
jgi:type I restriction enzyme M protein